MSRGTTKPVLDICVRNIGGTVPTANRIVANLRKADLLQPSKRGFGAADITSRDAAAILVALALSPTHSQAVETALRVLALEMLHVGTEGADPSTLTPERCRPVFAYLRGVGIHPLHTLGDALAALLDAMRSGAFAQWAAADRTCTLDFENNGCTAMLYALPASARTGVYAHFGTAVSFGQRGPAVTRLLRIDERLLTEIAAALGPLPYAAPCPIALPLPITESAIPPP